ncbi:MAG: HlyD family efflux transporter periplasmic adaptor subunit [Acidimicrobiales bacterium]|nr:HlyD family efflux transporter periplasmic adaptor subunit [Acidimicrobiales bacterium]
MRKILITLVVVAVAVGAVVAWEPWADEAAVVDPGIDRAIAESVAVRTLTDEITIRGELRRDELEVVTASLDGKVGHVAIVDGDIVEEGDALLLVDGRQSVAVHGDFSFYRQLDVGSQGADVHQLETVLSVAGYHVGEVDTLYTEETRSGLAAWQADQGYTGAAPEADEVVTVSLQSNPAGYVIGPVNAVSVRIGPAAVAATDLRESQSAAVVSTVAAVVDAVAVADTPVPTVSLATAAVVVQEGRPVLVTITADVAPVADLEIPVTVGGDVVAGDDYRSPEATVVLPAGSTSVTLEIATILDDDREPYEDLEVVIGGGFDSLAAVAPQTLAVYDARKEVDDLLERVGELVTDIAEQADEVANLEATDEVVTIVEARLISLGILTDDQARSGDVSPAEGEQLEALQVTVDDTQEVSDRMSSVTAVESRLVSLGVITMAQAESGDIDAEEAEQLEALQVTVDDTQEVSDRLSSVSTVESRLVSLGIITMAQAKSGDIDAEEAENIEALNEKVNDIVDAIAEGGDYNQTVTVLDRFAAIEARDEAAQDALMNITELDWLAAVAARDDAAQDALVDVTELDWRAAVAARDDALDDALKRSSALQTARNDLEVLEDEQQRLDYRLASARETLRVAQAARYVLGDDDEVTVSIDDPDVADVPILVLRADSETVAEGGAATFTIETTVELVEDLDVFYVVEGSATADADFNAPDGDITMQLGQERVTLSIPVRSDDDVEGDETLTVRLSADPAGNYRLSDRDQATMLIESSDLPELTLEGGGEVAEGETAVVTIVADQAPDTDTSVNYQVSGSAQAGQDYAVVTGTALLRAGERSVSVEIRTIDDDVVFKPGDMVVGDWPVRVGTVFVEEGDYVQRGTPLFDLTEPEFTITLFASPTDRAKLAEGQSVTVNLDAGDQESPGRIVELDDNATVSGTSETYEGVVEAVEDLVGVDGAVVTIDVVVEESIDAVVVPIAAVLSEGGQETVRVVTPEGTIERRAIQTGMLDGAYVEIVTGVVAGEYVILEIDRS